MIGLLLALLFAGFEHCFCFLTFSKPSGLICTRSTQRALLAGFGFGGNFSGVRQTVAPLFAQCVCFKLATELFEKIAAIWGEESRLRPQWPVSLKQQVCIEMSLLVPLRRSCAAPASPPAFVWILVSLQC